MERADVRNLVLAAAADPASDIAEAALWIAVEDSPSVDPGPWLGLLDDLAGQVDRTATERPSEAVASLLRSRLNLRGLGVATPGPTT